MNIFQKRFVWFLNSGTRIFFTLEQCYVYTRFALSVTHSQCLLMIRSEAAEKLEIIS